MNHISAGIATSIASATTRKLALLWPSRSDSDEKIERLNRLLILHLLLDRLLTLLVAQKLGACSQRESPDIQKIIVDVATLPIPRRMELAMHLGVIDGDVGGKILEVNRVRNSVIHFKPKAGSSGWDVDHVDEIAKQDDSVRCLRNGVEVAQALMLALDLPWR